MAFKKSFAQRLFNISRTAAKSAASNRQTTSCKITPDPGDYGVFRRFLHRESVSTSSGFRFLPTGEKLIEKLRSMDIAKDRIRLDGLRPPQTSDESPDGNLTVADAKKILRLSQIETVKSRLRQIEKNCISYSEFLEICVKECSCVDQGVEFAKMLDESGSVIVLGNIVFLRPEQVVKAIQRLMPVSPSPNPDDPRLKELQEMEKHKSSIDMKAESQVRQELRFGLGCLVVQTAAFMRLTFWELSWDVMEPVCFYFASVYFMGSYAFFLRTKKEPTFEGFFQGRFEAKQKRLMKAQNFDAERYVELKRACYEQRI